MLARCQQLLLVAGLVCLVTLELRRPTWQPVGAPRPTPKSFLPLGPEVEFLVEVGLQPPIGDTGEALHRWEKDVRVALVGEVTEQDRQAARAAVAQLDRTVSGLRISVGDDPNITLHITDPETFRKVVPRFKGRARNLAWCNWDGGGALRRAWLLVDREATPHERASRIRELLLRAMGLLGDTRGRWPSVLHRVGDKRSQEYSRMDLAALRLLYDPALSCGMTPGRVRDVLRQRKGGK